MNELARCFLAVSLPGSLIEVVQAVQVDIKRRSGGGDVRWVGPEQFHITLCFLGEVSAAQIAAMQEPILSACTSAHAMVLSLGKLSGFPNAVQPRIVTLEIEGASESLVTLQKSLATAVLPFAPGMDQKPFVPHLTLGRLKAESEMARTGIGRALRMVTVPPCPAFEVGHVQLIHTELGPSGPIYSVIRTFGLS